MKLKKTLGCNGIVAVGPLGKKVSGGKWELQSTDFQASTEHVCANVSSRLGAPLGQEQVVELDDDIGKVGELHEVRGDDVDPVHPGPLSLDPGDDGWQVPGAAREDKSENIPATQLLALKEKTSCFKL